MIQGPSTKDPRTQGQRTQGTKDSSTPRLTSSTSLAEHATPHISCSIPDAFRTDPLPTHAASSMCWRRQLTEMASMRRNAHVVTSERFASNAIIYSTSSPFPPASASPGLHVSLSLDRWAWGQINKTNRKLTFFLTAFRNQCLHSISKTTFQGPIVS